MKDRYSLETRDMSTPEGWARWWLWYYGDPDVVKEYVEKHSQDDLLADSFVGDLPWNSHDRLATCRAVLNSPEFDRANKVWLDTIGLSLKGEFVGSEDECEYHIEEERRK